MNNKLQRKRQKLKAISLNPANVFEDCLANLSSKSGVGKQYIERKWANAENPKLTKRDFKPVQTETLTVKAGDVLKSNHEAMNLLDQHGVCILTDFVGNDLALEAGQQMKSFLKSQKFTKNDVVNTQSLTATYGETEHYLWQTDGAKYFFYDEIIATKRPFINIRSKQKGKPDTGMVDVFGVESIAQKYNLDKILQCYQATRQSQINDLIAKVSGYDVKQANMYYNAGVTNTRGPHLDNNCEPYKIFIYLTDVLNENDGPYCYVPGSHKNRNWMSRERLINCANGYPSTEVSTFPRDKTTKLFGKAGTAIITCQSGIHCGWPQSESSRRVALVGNHN